MNRFIYKLFPPFLKRLDNYLLLNKPIIWASRVHYVFYFGTIALLINLILAYSQPINFSRIPDVNAFLLYCYCMGGVLLLPWFSFNILSGYRFLHGIGNKFDNLTISFLSFIIITFISLTAFIPYWCLTKRITNKVFDYNLPVLNFFDYEIYDDLEKDSITDINNAGKYNKYSAARYTYWHFGALQVKNPKNALIFELHGIDTYSKKITSTAIYKNQDTVVAKFYSAHEKLLDSLTIYFNKYTDSVFYSPVFRMNIYLRKFKVFSSFYQKDTALRVYCYLAPTNPKKLKGFTKWEVQEHLVADKVLAEVLKDTLEQHTESKIASAKYLLKKIENAETTQNATTWSYLFLIDAILVYITIISIPLTRFFGFKLFAIGLFLVCLVCASVIALLLFNDDIADTSNDFIASPRGIFFLTCLLIFTMVLFARIRVRTARSIIFLQFLTYIIPILIFLITALSWDQIRRAWSLKNSITAYDIGIPSLFIFFYVLLSLFTSKIYRLYVTPREG